MPFTDGDFGSVLSYSLVFHSFSSFAGKARQGLKCTACGYSCHGECAEKASFTCKKRSQSPRASGSSFMASALSSLPSASSLTRRSSRNEDRSLSPINAKSRGKSTGGSDSADERAQSPPPGKCVPIEGGEEKDKEHGEGKSPRHKLMKRFTRRKSQSISPSRGMSGTGEERKGGEEAEGEDGTVERGSKRRAAEPHLTLEEAK